MEPIYKTAYGSDQKYYVDGPGNGFSYYGGTLWPEMRFETENSASVATNIANKAFFEGYQRAQRDIKKVLGILD